MNLLQGDVYINVAFGDCWVVGTDDCMIRMNTGEILYLQDSVLQYFQKIGHVEGVENLDSNFYGELNHCPLCGSSQISCFLDFNNMKWKIGCKTEQCPCCVDHMVGTYKRKEEAVYNWNKRVE